MNNVSTSLQNISGVMVNTNTVTYSLSASVSEKETAERLAVAAQEFLQQDAIVSQQRKIVRDGEVELYALQKRIGEAREMANAAAQRRDQLRGELHSAAARDSSIHQNAKTLATIEGFKVANPRPAPDGAIAQAQQAANGSGAYADARAAASPRMTAEQESALIETTKAQIAAHQAAERQRMNAIDAATKDDAPKGATKGK